MASSARWRRSARARVGAQLGGLVEKTNYAFAFSTSLAEHAGQPRYAGR